MLRRVTWGLSAALIVAVAVTMSWNGTLAQTSRPQALAPETLLPASTVAYLRHAGTAAQQEAWEQTAAYEALVTSGLAESLDQWFEKLAERYPEMDVLRPLVWDVLEQGLTCGLSLNNAAAADIHGVIVLHRSGKHFPAIAELLDGAGVPAKSQMISGRRVLSLEMEPGSQVELSLFAEGEHLVCSIGVEAAEKVIAVAGGEVANVTSHPQWKAWNTAPARKVLSGVAWIDFASIRRQVQELPLSDGNEQMTNSVQGLLELLGVDGLDHAVARQGYEGKTCWATTDLKLNGPLSGLMAIFDAPTMTLKDLPPLPKNSTGVIAMSFDWLKIHDTVLNLMREGTKQFGPAEASDTLETQLASLDEMLGFSLRDDLAAGLGNVHAIYGDPSNAFMGMGFGVTIGVKDAEKIRNVADAILARVPFGQPGMPQLVTSEKRGRKLTSIGQPGVPLWPTFCVDDKWLIAGLSTPTVESTLARLDGKLPSWKPSAEQQAALKSVPEEFLSLTLNDPRPSLQGLSQGMEMLRGILASLPEGGSDFPLPEVPAGELIADPLFPNVVVSVRTKDGFAWQSNQSLPAIPLVGSLEGPSVGTTAVLVALLLPAVQQARTAARRTQSKNNLKQLALALHNHHDQHNAFPPGALPGKGEPTDRQSWMVAILPYVDQENLYRQINKDEAWNSDANKAASAVPLVLYQNPNLVTPPGLMGGYTDYVGIAGLGKDGPLLKVTDKKAGVFGYNRATSIRDIKDGTSNTLMTGEVVGDRGPWMQGGQGTIRPFVEQPYINGPDGFGGNWVGGANFGMADGSVRFLSENIDPSVLERLTTINGGEAVGDF